mgnify:CR=1 FL=1
MMPMMLAGYFFLRQIHDRGERDVILHIEAISSAGWSPAIQCPE